MKNSNIKKINTAGQVGYIISIILIVCTIIGMVTIGILTAGAIAIAKDNISVKVQTNVNINSTGNFLEKINSFIKFDGIEDLSALTEEAKEGIKINDSDIAELRVEEENGGLIINAKTKEIKIEMNQVVTALILAFIMLLAITVSLYMVKALMKSLKECETPFSEDVIERMSRLGTCLVCVLVIYFVIGGLCSSLLTGIIDVPTVNLESILLVAVIYILITVFKYGAGLQHESDETL